jgi:hypothetical protein
VNLTNLKHNKSMPEIHNQSRETRNKKISLNKLDLEEKKEIPILFSTPMVKALKNSTKTETRRDRNLGTINEKPNKWLVAGPRFVANCAGKGPGTWAAFYYHTKSGKVVIKHIKCPYGKLGDKIWVRETVYEHGKYVNWSGETGCSDTEWVSDNRYSYAASEPQPENSKTRPNIHMPKVAARIWLEITDIRCERLKDITNTASLAEGIETKDLEGTEAYRDYSSKKETFRDGTHFHPKNSYKTLWESINGTGSWAKNPWVWVIEFKKVSYKKPRGSYKRKI